MAVAVATGELQLLAVHGAARFNTEWLAGRDHAWTLQPDGSTPVHGP